MTHSGERCKCRALVTKNRKKVMKILSNYGDVGKYMV